MNNVDQLDAASVKPALAKKPGKPAAKKTHAIKHSLTLGDRFWAYCGKDTSKEDSLFVPEGTEPTCGTCKAHPKYQRLRAVKNFKARQILRMLKRAANLHRLHGRR